MVNVDDLVISLTIKETSKLGQLKKQLDAIVGKRGEKAPVFGLDPTIKMDLTFIKRKMNYLVPVVSPRSGEKQRLKAYAGSTKLLIQRYKGEISDFLSNLEGKEMNKMLEDFNVATQEQLSVAIEALMDDFTGEAEDIFKGITGGEKSKRFLDRINELIRSVRQKEGLKTTAIRELIESVPEAQERWEKILEKLGLIKTGQFKMFELQDEVINKNEVIKNWLELNKEGIDAFGKYFEGEKAVYEPLVRALTDLGFGDDLQNVLENIAEIQDDVNLQNLLGAMLKAFQKGLPARVPQAFKEYIQKVIKPLISTATGQPLSPTTGMPRKLDISVFKDAAKLLDILPEQPKNIQEALEKGFTSLELKNILKDTGTIRDQMRDYVKIFGDNLIILARGATREGRERAKSYGITKIITVPSLRPVEEKLGIERVISEISETKKALEKLTTEISEKTLDQARRVLDESGVADIPKVGLLGKELIDNVLLMVGKFDEYTEENRQVMIRAIEPQIRDFGLQTEENMKEISRVLGLKTQLRTFTSTGTANKIIMEEFIKPFYEKIKELPLSEIISEVAQIKGLEKDMTNKEMLQYIKRAKAMGEFNYRKELNKFNTIINTIERLLKPKEEPKKEVVGEEF